jgi:hypothetical protein
VDKNSASQNPLRGFPNTGMPLVSLNPYKEARKHLISRNIFRAPL